MSSRDDEPDVRLECVGTVQRPAARRLHGDGSVRRRDEALHFVSLVATMPLSLSFLATIDTPVTRPLVTTTGRWLPWALAAGLVALLITRPALLIHGFREPWWGGRMFVISPIMEATYALSGATSIFSLIVAISAYRRAAPGSITKERAKRYAIAFSVNDVSPADRVILKRLAAKLGVAAHDAAHIEEDTRQARSQIDGRAAARQEASVV